MDKDILRQIFRLAEDVFGTTADPDQIPPTPEYREKIDRLHLDCTAYRLDADGKVVGFVFVVPTSKEIMQRFLDEEITERAVLDLTQPSSTYSALYLCAVYVDPKFRRKGLASSMFAEILQNLPLSKDVALFYWPFTKEGEQLAQRASQRAGMHLLKRARR